MHMLLVLIFSSVVCGQFLRFGDSIEDDDSRSDERFFRRRQSFPNRRNRFDDSNESFFRGNRRRDFDSDEFFFGSRRNRIDFDDSNENFFGSNRNSFVRSGGNSFTRNNLRPVPPLLPVPRPSSFTPSAPRFNSNFNRNNNFVRNNNALRIDSVEDLFEDLFDDDLDDRLRAQNALSRLNNNGFFRNSGLSQNRGFTSFNTRLGNTNRFNSPASTRSNLVPISSNQNAFNHFTAAQHSNRIPSTQNSNRFNDGFSFRNSFGSSNNQANRFNRNQRVPAFNTFNSNRRSPSSSNRRSPSTSNSNRRSNSFSNNRISGFNSKRSSSSPLNAIRSSAKKSPFTSDSGFNWPGGNGYYVSMSTGNSKPVSYFVAYDD